MENVAVGRLLGSMYRASHAFVLDRLKKSGIGFGQYPFLLYLKDHQGVSQDQIAAELCFDKGTTTRALQKLEEQGFITRTAAAKDRRRHEVELTAEGKRLCKNITRAVDEWNDVLMKGIAVAKKDVTLQVLRTMLNNILVAIGKKGPEAGIVEYSAKSVPLKKQPVTKKAPATKKPVKKTAKARGKIKR
jgi:DNA-binding MarR family transcriptional regulator